MLAARPTPPRPARSRISLPSADGIGQRAVHPQAHLRVRQLQELPAAGHRARGRRRRRAGADAHRRRQVGHLPDPRADAAGSGRGRLAADRADAEPGRGARGGRRARGLPQLHAQFRRRGGGRTPAARRRTGPRLRRARAARHGALPAPARRPRAGRRAGAVRHRRGALRVAVGPRLPPRVRAACAAARTVPGGAAHRAHGHGRRADAHRDRRAPAGRAEALRRQLRPPQHPLPGGREARAARAAAAVRARRASGRRRHRLLPGAQLGGRGRGVPRRPRHQGAALPRRDGREDARGQPAPLPRRGRAS